jgi:DNA-binding CsgD family transcriptional regulator
MKKLTLSFFVTLIFSILFSCENKYYQILANAEPLVPTNPDSARGVYFYEDRVHPFFFYIALFILFLLLFIAIGFGFYRKQKNELLKAKQTVGSLEEMLHIKDFKENKLRELLLEKLDFAKKIAQMSMHPSNSNNYNFIKQFHRVFGYNIDENLNWANLYPIINELYNNIVDKLKVSYPTLTDKELQLCCLVRAEFRQDEIAFILSYEYNSIKTIKMRLRMKMKFDNNDDFNQFLINL